MNPFLNLYSVSVSWFMVNGFRVAFVVIGTYIVIRLIAVFTDRLMHHLIRSDFRASSEDERKRRDTLVRIVVRTSEVALYLVAGMMILSEFGINIGPLIAGAGVIGLAVGFGAQQLVKDTISGIFIVMENRYHVGDSVTINNVSGIVDDLNLRVTRIKDVDQAIHYIQNGSITSCVNLSAEGGRIHFPLKVSAKADLNRVREIVEAVGKGFATDERTKTSVRKTPSVERIDAFDATWITVHVAGDVATSRQWEVASDLKLQLKRALDEAGIEASA